MKEIHSLSRAEWVRWGVENAPSCCLKMSAGFWKLTPTPHSCCIIPPLTKAALKESTPMNCMLNNNTTVERLLDASHNNNAYNTLHHLLSSSQQHMFVSDEELGLINTLKGWRECTQHTFVQALEAAQLSPTFVSEVMDCNIDEYFHHVMMKAAVLQREPKLANTSFSFRVRLYFDQHKVASCIRWLRYNGLSAPCIIELILMVKDNVENLWTKIKWLKSTHIRGQELATVLLRMPCILDRSIKELDAIACFLEEKGLNKGSIGLIVTRSPILLSLGIDELQERETFLTGLGIHLDDLGSTIFAFPAVLGRLAVHDMICKVEYLKSIGLQPSSLGRVIARKPQLLACNIENEWKPLIMFLHNLGVDQSGLRRILVKHPSVFCLNLSGNIVPKVHFLLAIGLHNESIGSLIVRFPAILSYSLEKKMCPVVRFLLEVAGVSEDNISKVIGSYPELFGCSLTSKMEVVARYLLAEGIEKEELGLMVTRFPMLLTYSLSVVEAKVSYLRSIMFRPMSELVIFPRFFSYSLNTRIASRHKMLRERELHFDLKHMLACRDDQFLKRLEAASLNKCKFVQKLCE